jgi:hypothetical protein
MCMYVMYMMKTTYTSKMYSNFIFNYIKKQREGKRKEWKNKKRKTVTRNTCHLSWIFQWLVVLFPWQHCLGLTLDLCSLSGSVQKRTHYLNFIFLFCLWGGSTYGWICVSEMCVWCDCTVSGPIGFTMCVCPLVMTQLLNSFSWNLGHILQYVNKIQLWIKITKK